MPSKTDHTAPSGVYAIRHVASGKFYVGSATDMPARWERHRDDLAKGRHHSRHLQRAWDKYGAAAFIFEVLRFVVGEADLRRCEQEHLDDLQPWRRPLGYNISSDAIAPMVGLTHTPEARAKMSKALKGRIFTPEHRARIGAANGRRTPEQITEYAARRVNTKHSEETKAKISAANKGHRVRLGIKHTAETRAKISATKRTKAGATCKGRKHSDESRAKMSAAQKGKVISPDSRAKMSAARRAYFAAKRAAQQQQPGPPAGQMLFAFDD